jgi:tetratricopeptide (TPR) repeat protein
MTRPARNQLVVVVFVIAAFFAAPRLSDAVLWGAAALATPLVLLALWVTRPFHRARTLLRTKKYDEAAAELAAFETSLTQASWKRALAAMAVGFYTSNPVAAARNTLGAVRLEQGQLDAAQAHFRAALEQDPGYAVPWGNVAVLAAMRGDAAGAEDARLKAAALGFKPRLLSDVIKDKLAAGRSPTG